ncbi:MAG: UTP--glucose-1-phosphate uridylyltransferase [Planctomycetes bacterium]|nr:UTP--glucose-1-phosphate uridylyltransferase [Planctomycetota bacterium]
MMEPLAQSEARLRHAFAAAGQGHVFRFWPSLAPPARERFLAQLESIDLALLARLVQEMKGGAPVAALDLERLAPAPFIALPDTPGARRGESRARRAGEELLRAGKVAALVVAGGQGSRLGLEVPKGCLPIGPVSGCSLFEWHFAKVLATRLRVGADIPLLILTSAATDAATRSFLADRRCFGLPERDVLLFRQGMLPAVDGAGRLLLSAPDSLFLSPDGHGGTLAALVREGVLDELERRGIEQIFYFQVDNPLVKVLDPTFLGRHVLARSEMSSKVVIKRDAAEKVGVIARAGRKLGVVEYSDLPRDLAEARDAEGRLLFRAGSIAIHAISVRFVRSLHEAGVRLPFHRANKAIPCVGDGGEGGAIVSQDGCKFETFVFDALPRARKALVVETDRAQEFSPVKNAAGENSAETARADLVRLFRSWVEAAGFRVEGGQARIEISPLFSLDQEQFVRRLRKECLLCREGLLLS